MKLKNQTRKKNRNFYFDKENPTRSVILSGEVDETSVFDIIQFICDINEFDDENEENIVDYERKPIKLIINSFGGSVYDGFALIGVIEKSETPIHTYCFGSAMSMSLLIFVSGHKRFAHRLSTFMYHECLDSLPYDKLSILKENLEETNRIMEVYDTFLIEKTTIKKKQLLAVRTAKKDWYFDVNEALKNKVTDIII
jgi:ATP-dependent Clp protease protease subunit